MTGRFGSVPVASAVRSDALTSNRLVNSKASDAAASAVKAPLMKVGMVVGYLGLVMMLSMAPFWHQVITPSAAQPLVCTDFGGSR